MSTPRIYLFGSSIEHPETRFGAKKEKVSLEEIFRTTKVTDEIPSENEVKEEMQAKKTHKSAKYFIKKIQSFNLLQETLPLLLVMKLPILFLPRKNLIRCVFLQYFI